MSKPLMTEIDWRRAVADHLESGRSLTDSASKYGCSYSSFHKKVQELRAQARISVVFGHDPELVGAE